MTSPSSNLKITDDNPHVRHEGAWQVSFWKNGTACGVKDADYAKLATWTPNIGWTGFREYKLPDDKYILDENIRGMKQVFTAGMDAGKAEVRKALGLY